MKALGTPTQKSHSLVVRDDRYRSLCGIWGSPIEDARAYGVVDISESEWQRWCLMGYACRRCESIQSNQDQS